VPITGGSEVYRIERDGEPRRVWSNGQDVIYTIAFDNTGHALLGAGNRGNIYRIESPTRYTVLLTVSTTPATRCWARAIAATSTASNLQRAIPYC
jgi:hypothetical protein